MLSDAIHIEIEQLHRQHFIGQGIEVFIARLDKIHPIVSGNKAFKLHYLIAEAISKNKSTIITFGGAYSNHIVSTAYYCNIAGLKSIAFIRGERPEQLSHTLLQCKSYGMELKFISRMAYGEQNMDILKDLTETDLNECLIIPEGGYHPLGAKGAAMIMDRINSVRPTHICTAVGTASTLAGLVQKKSDDQTIIGIPVLKGMTDIEKRMEYLLDNEHFQMPVIWDEYHFGGYSKKTPELLEFMNQLYREFNLPTDFVYTAKMMYAVLDKLQKNYFPKNSSILCLHTGGLQGNLSLPEGSLCF